MSRTAQSNKIKIAVIGVIAAALVALGGLGYMRTTKPSQPPAAVPQPTQPEQTTSFSYQGEAGKTALELLKAKAQVETKPSSLGEYVVSINGNDGGGTKYWLFYVDGKEAAEGASTYITKNGETIEWKLQ